MKRSVVSLVSVASVVLFAGTGFAQDATFDLKFDAPGGTRVSGAPGATVEVPITLILDASERGVSGIGTSTVAPDCPDAADANNDERINIADAIEIVMVIFRGKPAIPPFVECGKDAETDSESCPPNSSTECSP